MADYDTISDAISIEFMRATLDDGTTDEYIDIQQTYSDLDGSEISTVSVNIDEARALAEALLKMIAVNARGEGASEE